MARKSVIKKLGLKHAPVISSSQRKVSAAEIRAGQGAETPFRPDGSGGIPARAKSKSDTTAMQQSLIQKQQAASPFAGARDIDISGLNQQTLGVADFGEKIAKGTIIAGSIGAVAATAALVAGAAAAGAGAGAVGKTVGAARVAKAAATWEAAKTATFISNSKAILAKATPIASTKQMQLLWEAIVTKHPIALAGGIAAGIIGGAVAGASYMGSVALSFYNRGETATGTDIFVRDAVQSYRFAPDELREEALANAEEAIRIAEMVTSEENLKTLDNWKPFINIIESEVGETGRSTIAGDFIEIEKNILELDKKAFELEQSGMSEAETSIELWKTYNIEKRELDRIAFEANQQKTADAIRETEIRSDKRTLLEREYYQKVYDRNKKEWERQQRILDEVWKQRAKDIEESRPSKLGFGLL